MPQNTSLIHKVLDKESVTPISTRLCHAIYCRSDKSYPCLVGIGLTEKRENIAVIKATCHIYADVLNNKHFIGSVLIP